jgi:hypothetical protein
VVQAFLSLMNQEGRTATDQAEGHRAPVAVASEA